MKYLSLLILVMIGAILFAGCTSPPQQTEPKVVYITVTVTPTPLPSPVPTTMIKAMPTQIPMNYKKGYVVGDVQNALCGVIISDLNYETGEYALDFVERRAATSDNWAYSYGKSNDPYWIEAWVAEEIFPYFLTVTDPDRIPEITWESLQGYQIAVVYSGDWQGAYMVDGSTKSISGEGNRVIYINRYTPDHISVTIQKMDKGGWLIVGILHEGIEVKQEKTNAEYGLVTFSYSPD